MLANRHSQWWRNAARNGSCRLRNPFKGQSMLELFSTHPSTQHRVERLKKIAREMNLYVPQDILEAGLLLAHPFSLIQSLR